MLETILKPPRDNAALFVDMNSFFASVEQQEQPELRGRPVGVCPFIHDSTCIIAASIEAKRQGVRTGTKVGEARRLCPEIQLIANHTDIYRDYHRRIMTALDQTRCQVTVRSIDEAYLKVPEDLRPHVLELAQEVKTRIRGVGSQLASSVGIAPNMFLAKLATNLQKPDGLVEIRLRDLEGLYATLGLRDLPGISWRMERRFQLAGIQSVRQLHQASYGFLNSLLGVTGQCWYLRLRGYEVDQKPPKRGMVGHQTTIHPRPASTPQELLPSISQLCYKTASRLHQAGLAASTVALYFRFADRTHWAKVHHGKVPFSDPITLLKYAKSLLPQRLPRPVRLVGVSTFNLVPLTSLTQPIWETTRHQERISQAAELINQRFGAGTIRPARHLIGEPISNQVGFGNARHTLAEVLTK